MLHDLKTENLGLKIIPFRVNSTSGTPIASGFGEPFSSFTDTATGVYETVLKEPFGRNGIALAMPSYNTQVNAHSRSTTTALSSRTIGNFYNGGDFDTVSQGLIFLYDDASADRTGLQSVKTPYTGAQLDLVSIASDGTLNYGADICSVSKTATGIYTLTWKATYGVAPIVVGSIVGGTAGRINYDANGTAQSQVIRTYNIGGASLSDYAFTLLVYGVKTNNAWTTSYNRVQTTTAKARILPITVKYSGGVPAATVGLEHTSSVADTGTGDALITLSRPFRNTVALGGGATSTATNGHAQLGSVSVSTAQSLHFNVAAAADPSGGDVGDAYVLFGSDFP
jgi:hypothetical protein